MNPYFGVTLIWAIAAAFFYNCYYGIRYPDKYIKTGMMFRGLPKNRESVSVGVTASMLVGLVLFGTGFLILYGLVTDCGAPPPPLPRSDRQQTYR